MLSPTESPMNKKSSGNTTSRFTTRTVKAMDGKSYADRNVA